MEQWSIIVCDRGYVLAGIVRPGPDPLRVIVDRCVCVRRWGTTAGLGELARTGPTKTTQLDPEGDGVLVGLLHVLRQIPCNEEASRKWTLRTS